MSCRVGRLELWCVGQSEEGSEPGVGERVLETMVLVEITILKRRVEVLKVHLEPAVTIMLCLAQVVVDGVARLESVTTGGTLEVFPMVQTITTSVLSVISVTASVSVAGIAVGTIPVVIVVVIIVFGMLRVALVILFLVAIAFVMFLVFRLMFVMILVVVLVVFVVIFAV